MENNTIIEKLDRIIFLLEQSIKEPSAMDGKSIWILVLAIACIISSGVIFYLTNKIKKLGGW